MNRVPEVTSLSFGRKVLGTVSLAGGAALVTYIVTGFSLGLGLAFSIALQMVAVIFVWRRTERTDRRQIIMVFRVGSLAGAGATALYDLTKFTLSLLEPSVYNPFEAIRMFGVALAGARASPSVILEVGLLYHLFNGTMFGIAFAILLGKRGVLAGIGWGVFLEIFQLTLFPGWLSIKAYKEFAQISALSHLVYGATLGLICRHWLVDSQKYRKVEQPILK